MSSLIEKRGLVKRLHAHAPSEGGGNSVMYADLDFTLDNLEELSFADPVHLSTSEAWKQHRDHLWRGGGWGYYWTPSNGETYTDKTGNQQQVKRSLWAPIHAEIAPPRGWDNVYFGVNPTAHRGAKWQRSANNPGGKSPHVVAINALFAEYDGKDFVTSGEYTPYLPEGLGDLDAGAKREAIASAKERVFDDNIKEYKARAYGHILTLERRPSVLIDSGSGYHAYWYLRDTVKITDENREEIKGVQAAWVGLVGGDEGAKDLARVLRVAGTHNHKGRFGNNPPLVDFVWFEPDRLYDYANLSAEALVWGAGQAQEEPSAHNRVFAPSERQGVTQGDMGAVRAAFNADHSLVEILTARGYRIAAQNSHQTRMIRPGGDSPSVTVSPANGDRPEIATFFNPNDALFTGEGGRDAFSIYAFFEYGGDERTAWTQAKRDLGMWEERRAAPSPVENISDIARRIMIAIADHGFTKPANERAAIAVAQWMEMQGTTQVRINVRHLGDMIGLSKDAAADALRWLCPEELKRWRRYLVRKSDEWTAQLDRALALGDNVDELWSLLTEDQRATVQRRIDKQCREQPDQPVDLAVAVVDYISGRAKTYTHKLNAIDKGLDQGELMPLLDMVRPGTQSAAGVYRLSEKHSEKLQTHTDTIGYTRCLKFFTMLSSVEFVGENMTDDAYARNAPQRKKRPLYADGDAASLANAQVDHNRAHAMDGNRYHTGHNGELMTDEAPEGDFIRRALDSFGTHAPRIVGRLQHATLTYSALEEDLGVSAPTLRTAIKRMGSELEAVGLAPLVEVHRIGVRKFISIAPNYEERLQAARPQLRQQGMIANRTRYYLSERLQQLDKQLGYESASDRFLLLGVVENTGNLGRFLRGENVESMTAVSSELAAIETALSYMPPSEWPRPQVDQGEEMPAPVEIITKNIAGVEVDLLPVLPIVLIQDYDSLYAYLKTLDGGPYERPAQQLRRLVATDGLRGAAVNEAYMLAGLLGVPNAFKWLDVAENAAAADRRFVNRALKGQAAGYQTGVYA